MVYAQIEDLAAVTYAIPLKRLRPLMTRRLKLDTVKGSGSELALLTTTCFWMRMGRGPSRIPAPRIHVIAFWTWAIRNEKKGAYLFRAIVTPRPAARALQSLTTSVVPGKSPFPPTPRPQAFMAGNISHEIGFLQQRAAVILRTDPTLADQETPLGAVRVVGQLLANHPALYFWLGGRWLWMLPITAPSAALIPALPLHIRLPLWHEMGLVSTAEIAAPMASFTAAPFTVSLAVPRPNLDL